MIGRIILTAEEMRAAEAEAIAAGAPVEIMFEQTSNGQLIPEWRVVTHG